jgi:hypothetical protein
MTATDAAIEELKRAGLFDRDSDYGGMIGEAVKELLLVFQKQGHSGYSAQVTASIFHKLIKGEPLSPLTNDPSEWMEVGSSVFQSIRVSHVFINKNESERPYTIDGKVFSDDGGKSYYISIDSRVYFDLPGFPPKTEYVILKEEQKNV